MPPKDRHTDPALLTRVATGDHSAFADLVDIYSSTIYGHLLIYLKNAPEAEDITQEIFTTLWRKRADLPDVQNLDAYIFIITRNRAITAFKNKITSSPEPPTDELQSGWQTPSDSTEYRQLSEAIQQGIDHLPPRRKEVFTLSRMHNKTYDEIAQQLGISRSAVRQHIIEALVFLRTWLHERYGIIVSMSIIFFTAT